MSLLSFVRSFFSSTVKPYVDPPTLAAALRDSAARAMDRGDLLTRGDCLMAALRLERMEEEQAALWSAVQRLEGEKATLTAALDEIAEEMLPLTRPGTAIHARALRRVQKIATERKPLI